MKIIIFLFLFSPFLSFAQEPDPRLFQTWYLREVCEVDPDPAYYVSEIEPPIFPYITIEESYEFSGQAACNTFEGILNFVWDSAFVVEEFSSTGDDCGYQVHNAFEDAFFGLLQDFELDFSIFEVGDGLRLNMSHVLMGYAMFYNYPLSQEDENIVVFNVYPNPFSEKINLSASSPIVAVKVFDIYGKIVFEDTGTDIQVLKVSELSQGVYFLQIKTFENQKTMPIIKK